MREILFRGKDDRGKWAYGRLAYDVMSLGTPDAIVGKNGITAVEYEVSEKLVSFRSGIMKRTLTDEQRRKIGARLHKRRKDNA